MDRRASRLVSLPAGYLTNHPGKDFTPAPPTAFRVTGRPTSTSWGFGGHRPSMWFGQVRQCFEGGPLADSAAAGSAPTQGVVRIAWAADEDRPSQLRTGDANNEPARPSASKPA